MLHMPKWTLGFNQRLKYLSGTTGLPKAVAIPHRMGIRTLNHS
jgi:hypothetical protein